jgi:hypothetical protein
MEDECYLVRGIYYVERHNLTAVMREQIEIEEVFLLDIKYSRPICNEI